DAPLIPRSWRGSGLAENNIDESDTVPQVAVDSVGVATVAWTHGTTIWANRIDTRTGVAGTEGAVGGSSADNPHVAVDGNGVATVIWEGASSSDANTRGIWSSTATGTGWTAPYRISSGVAFAA